MKVVGHATVGGPCLEPTDGGLGVWLLGKALALLEGEALNSNPEQEEKLEVG